MTCRHCKGDKDCPTCDGTGDGKSVNIHPAPWDVDEDGDVDCPDCGGSGICGDCDGTGEEDDEDEEED